MVQRLKCKLCSEYGDLFRVKNESRASIKYLCLTFDLIKDTFMSKAQSENFKEEIFFVGSH